VAANALAPALVDGLGVQKLRVLVGVLLGVWILWQAIDRWALEDDDDPSLAAGGDWAMVRFSGPALVALVGVVAALALVPALEGMAGLKAGLAIGASMTVWGYAKWRDP
jgi:hypothetical protein